MTRGYGSRRHYSVPVGLSLRLHTTATPIWVFFIWNRHIEMSLGERRIEVVCQRIAHFRLLVAQRDVVVLAKESI